MLNLLEFATLFLVGKFGVKVLIYIKNLYPPLCPRLLDLVQLGDEVDVKFIGVCNAFLGGKIWCESFDLHKKTSILLFVPVFWILFNSEMR